MMDRSTFSRDGVALSVASTGTGKPVVFQHGLGGAATQPAEVFPGGIGFRCLTLECRGHGQSGSGDMARFSIACFTEDLAALIDSLGVGPVPVGGISMGAAIAMRLAAVRPDLVSALVLVRPAWIDQPAPENLSPTREAARLMAEHPPKEALARFRASPAAALLARDGKDNLASLLGVFGGVDGGVTQALLAAIASDGPGLSEGDIAGLQCPTLVIGHARDVIHPLPMARRLADLIPGARLAEVTPKADSFETYRSDVEHALRHFLTEIA